jgi:hypothetical protein
MLKASNIHYEMAPRVQGLNCGGIGALHLLVQRLGLVADLDRSLAPAQSPLAVSRKRPRIEHRL